MLHDELSLESHKMNSNKTYMQSAIFFSSSTLALPSYLACALILINACHYFQWVYTMPRLFQRLEMGQKSQDHSGKIYSDLLLRPFNPISLRSMPRKYLFSQTGVLGHTSACTQAAYSQYPTTTQITYSHFA